MAEGQALATRAARGFLWTVSASLLQILVILLIYHSLPTEVVGGFEGALLYVVLLALVAELGLSEALVQNREAGEETFDAAFWVSFAVGVGLAAAIYAVAGALSTWIGGDHPADFARAAEILCLMLPCAAVSGVFRARLQRDLNFAAVALSEVVSVAAFAAVTAALLSRLGILAVIAGSVIREAALLASLWRSARWVPRWRCSWRALRPILGFGLHLTGSRIVGYLSTYLANFYVLGYLGSRSLGYYRLSERLTLQPLTRLATTIFRVSLPTFATIQDDDAQLRSGYLASVQSLTLVLGPLLAGLYMLAPELLELVGNRPALTVLRLLAVATLLKVIGTMVGSMFMAKGKASWQLYWSLFNLAVLIPAMQWALPRGVEGIAAVIAGSSLLFLVLSQQLANRLIGLPFTDYLRALIRPLLVVATVGLALAVARPVWIGPPLAVLGQGAATTMIAGLAGLRLFAWDLCRASVRSLRGRRTTR